MEVPNYSVGASGPRKSLTGRSCQGEGGQAFSPNSISGATLQPADSGVGGRLHSHSKGGVGETGHREGHKVEVAPPNEAARETLRSVGGEVDEIADWGDLQGNLPTRPDQPAPADPAEQTTGLTPHVSQGADPAPLNPGARVVDNDNLPEGSQTTGVDMPQAGEAEHQHDLEGNIVLMFIPSGRGVYTCPLCPSACTHFRELKSHFAKQHPTWVLKAKCRPCGFTGEFHSVRCHQPKCKGSADQSASTDLKFKCALCAKSFQTKPGLGQHERHAHPVARNKCRILSTRPEASEKACGERKKNIWAEDDIRKLAVLQLKHQEDTPHINILLAKKLAKFTANQIRDKKNTSKFKRVLEEVKREQTTTGSPQVRNIHDTVHVMERPPSPIPEMQGDITTCKFTDPKGTLLSDNPSCVQLDLLEILLELREGHENVSTKWGSVETIVNGLQAKWADEKLSEGPNKPKIPHRTWRRKPRSKKSKERAASYRQCQILWGKNKKRLATKILDGDKEADCPLSTQTVDDFWRPKLATTNDKCHLSGWEKANDLADNETLLRLISCEEVVSALKSQKKTSAAGPDKVTMRTLLLSKETPCTLALLYNICMVAGKIPDSLKSNRTILIPKGGDAAEPGNWRPITIGSLMLRIFTKVMVKRLQEAVPLCERQRGFISAPGCTENLTLLDKCLEKAKTSGHCSVAFIDLAKAFDMVGHRHLQRSLERMGICAEWRSLIEDLYRNSSTTIHVGKDRKTGLIPILRGVKQGDPLSPILFNIAMDPLLTSLENAGKGFKYGSGDSERITALAFADDLAALASSSKNLQWICNRVEKFCEDTGMRINVKKSAAFCITSKGKT